MGKYSFWSIYNSKSKPANDIEIIEFESLKIIIIRLVIYNDECSIPDNYYNDDLHNKHA